MEFLDGKSLSDRLKQGALPAAECRRVLRQICEALEAAHRQGIVHRDLKPDNILLAEPQHGESFAKLLDFGIAKLMGDGDAATRTQTGRDDGHARVHVARAVPRRGDRSRAPTSTRWA